MNSSGKAKENLVFAFKIIVTIILSAMTLMIFVNAALRYITNGGIAAFEELSRYAFVWVSTLGAIVAYYTNKHVGVDLLVVRLHGLSKLIVQIISEILVLAALAILIIGGWRFFGATINQQSAAIPIPMGIITISPFVMGLGMLPKTLMCIKSHVDNYRNNHSHLKEKEVGK